MQPAVSDGLIKAGRVIAVLKAIAHRAGLASSPMSSMTAFAAEELGSHGTYRSARFRSAAHVPTIPGLCRRQRRAMRIRRWPRRCDGHPEGVASVSGRRRQITSASRKRCAASDHTQRSIEGSSFHPGDHYRHRRQLYNRRQRAAKPRTSWARTSMLGLQTRTRGSHLGASASPSCVDPNVSRNAKARPTTRHRLRARRVREASNSRVHDNRAEERRRAAGKPRSPDRFPTMRMPRNDVTIAATVAAGAFQRFVRPPLQQQRSCGEQP